MKKIYSGAYKIYKILPLISAALTLFFSFVFGIADAAAGITELGDELDFGAIIVWMLIGGILAVINSYRFDNRSFVFYLFQPRLEAF